MNRSQNCSLCHGGDDSFTHKGSLEHRFNFALYEWNEYRRAVVKNRDGVEVEVNLYNVVTNRDDLIYTVNENKGRHETKLLRQRANHEMHANSGINYMFTVKNIQRSKNILLSYVRLLHPYTAFKLNDFEGQMGENVILRLLPGSSYSFIVTFYPENVTIGTYSMPVAIDLQSEKIERNFTISREMVINIVGTVEFNHQEEKLEKNPFTNSLWKEGDINFWHKSTITIPTQNAYAIPTDYYKIIKMGVTEFYNMAHEEVEMLNKLRHLMHPMIVTKSNYQHFFHILLWIDEMGSTILLQRYNMENVTMKVIANGVLAELEVPGLAEKRPSLINGDIVNIRLHGDRIAYQGIIKTVNNSNIWIQGIHKELLEYMRDCPDSELDVTFQLSRLPYERMHAGIDACVRNNMVNYLFPENIPHNLPRVQRLPDDKFINPYVRSNPEQRAAVEHILYSNHNIAPYIIFGPPGTGKTITIVEAILQLIRNKPKIVVLICAPANAACDMLASRLIESHQLSTDQLIRVHSDIRDWSTVPDNVKRYSNYVDGMFTKPKGFELMKYRVIVTTLILSGRYYNSGFQPDYLFIDEAAQAMEPEASVAIGLLTPRKQVVLAGDPKQLGPICGSMRAEKLKLNVSLLERLTDLPLYKSDNQHFITTLKLNFRSHSSILHIPNILFYGSQLKAVSEKSLLDPIAKICIYDKISRRRAQQKQKKELDMALEFCAIFAKEMRQGRSPSYFNPKEAEMVLNYVEALLNLIDCTVVESDIGIVTPYIRQVYRLKDLLQKNGHSDIEVGTTEAFQGREKRIIIISTVRAQHDLLLFDRKYKLGFVANEKRLNVAITRAMSKLIIIGCPNVLQVDKNWKKLIVYCEEKHSYFGAKRDIRDSDLRQEVLKRLGNFNTQYQPYAIP